MNELIKNGNLITWKVQISKDCDFIHESSRFEIQYSKCYFLFYTGYRYFTDKGDIPLSLSIFFVDTNKLNPPVDITARVILPSETISLPRQTITGEYGHIWSSFDVGLRGSLLTVEMVIHDPGMKGMDESAKCFSCKESLETEFISLHEKCTDRRVKCPDCSGVFLLQDLLRGHQCERKREGGKIVLLASASSSASTSSASLSEDYKRMLQDGIHHDLTLKVGDKEIRAHKDVLRARSQVFKSMLEHDMKERNSGVIDVPDCDPQAMEVFLSYVYSGKVDALDANNMLHLYYIADKYQTIELKNECSSFIKRSLSPTNLCDVIRLALKHSDTDLLNVATEYFNNNVLDVLQTVEWQAFMKDNSTVANELLIKSYKKVLNY